MFNEWKEGGEKIDVEDVQKKMFLERNKKY